MMKKRLAADIILIAVILLIGVGSVLVLNETRQEGAYAVVIIDGAESARYPLSRDRVEVIEIGEYRNTLVIRDGEAFVSEANCPDGRCSRHAPVKYDGETVICLPHKLVIEIEK